MSTFPRCCSAMLYLLCAYSQAVLFAQNASEAEIPLATWAVIGDEDALHKGIVDLLTVKLSSNDGLSLVERADLDVASQELELTTLSAAVGSQKRLTLGQTVGADALLIVAIEERNGKQVVRIVISECRWGARLRTGYVPLDTANIQEVVDRAVQLVNLVRQQYRTGITQLIGVPPFLSRNLEHRYDALQLGYKRLLEEGLVDRPGVAVLELEEARTIQQELSDSARQLANRPVASIVEAEFEMNELPEGGVQVTLEIVVREHSVEPRLVARDTMALERVPEFLYAEAAEKILLRDAQRRTLDPTRQFKVLAARADEFGDLGVWERSIELREAALLLEPAAVEQRLVLIAEREYVIRAAKSAQDRQLSELNSEPDQQRAYREHVGQDRVSDWRIRRQHIEYLIRNRQLNPREASYLVSHELESRRQLPRSDLVLDEADAFFWSMFQRIPGLDYAVARGQVRRGLERSFDLINLRPEKWSRPYQLQRWISDGYRTLVAGKQYVRPSVERAKPREAGRITKRQVHGTRLTRDTLQRLKERRPDLSWSEE